MGISTEIKVGIFATITVATLMLMVIILDGNPFAKKHQIFYTELENVGGVGVRTQVRTSGVQIGEVVSIDVLDTGARVNFSVRADVPIPENSFLELKSRGILGDVFIEVVRNTRSLKMMLSGTKISKRAEASDFNSLMNLVGNMTRDLQAVTKNLAVVLGGQEGQTSLSNILHNIEKITADSSELLASQKDNVEEIVERISP